ncbi:hypothetical protein [Bradyrhizobium sp. STM 3562]|uniref:hypothetical protein n=1 Tax=Bradyrhizobium sp. STM 3562 TaxID=578924 RepID=UPI00388D673F
MVDKKKLKRGKKNPIDDRIVFFMKMTPRVIKEIKQAALEEDRAAWAVMEEAAEQWLARRRAGRRP